MNKIKVILLALVTVVLTVSCTKNESSVKKEKIGMVTDAGTIDDKSFNQGTWEGILRAESDLNVAVKYLKPSGTTEADYLKEIGNLNDAGYKFIITPGFKFATAINKAQNKYRDTKFVLIDASPETIQDNTISIFFAEHEAGFLAGVATALQINNGSVGFIGGMEIPPVQRFNWGFQQGIDHANMKLGTEIELDAENVIYQGTFHEVAAGQALAAQMFDKGVDAIFCAAGGVGVGAINEAKSRAVSGKEAWIVGVDSDQYADGIYEGDKSVILTSALKRVDNAAFDMISAYLNGSFEGGSTLMFNALNDGIGLPKHNPNLSDSVMKQVRTVYNEISIGVIEVSGEQGNLIK